MAGSLAAFLENSGLVSSTHIRAHKLSVTPVLEDLMPTSGLYGHCSCMVHRQMQIKYSYMFKKLKKFKQERRKLLEHLREFPREEHTDWCAEDVYAVTSFRPSRLYYVFILCVCVYSIIYIEYTLV